MNIHFIPSVCSYCATGCGVLYQVSGCRVTGVMPNPSSPVNNGGLCIKGWNLHEFVNARGRLTTPLLRTDRQSELRPSSWDEALALTGRTLKGIVERHGADSVAVLSSARMTNEENYLAQKFTRAVIGTNNIDHCARL